MSCRRIAPDVVDYARGLALEPERMEHVIAHLPSCAACTSLADRERAMSMALRRLADEQPVPAANDRQLDALLSCFDRGGARPRRASVVLEWSLAAAVVIVAGVAAGWRSEAPVPGASGVAATPAQDANDSAFVVLPGAEALPRFEHGQVIRVDIPGATGVVHAEVLIGQDGLARAARLVQ